MKKYFTKFLALIMFSSISVISTKTCSAQSWSSVGTGLDSYVFTFLTDPVNNVLYAGGNFINSGATTVNHVAKWDGTNWTAMGTGTNNNVFSFAIYNGELYMAGIFTTADGNPCNRVARWDGSAWQQAGTGMDGDVFCLLVYNGELYAGGSFTTADGNPANNIAKWNGTNWLPLGSGIAGNYVYSIQYYNGEIYTLGKFSDAGGVPVNNMARWDGTNWNDVGGGVKGLLEVGIDLLVYNNELYTTGSFLTAGTDTVHGIAKWNGTSWSGFGSGLTGSVGYGDVLFNFGGRLYLGGNFTNANGVSANFIASYDGANWDTLGVGCDGEVEALENYGGELFVGGGFNDAGGLGIPKVAKWSTGCTAAATALGQNISCLGSCDGAVSVNALGYAPFTYVWSSGDTTDLVSGLCPGTYNITITDSAGCIAEDSVTIVEFALPTTSVTGSAPLCPAQCNGSAIVTPTGRSPFTYSWTTVPVQTADTAVSLCAGTYYVTVTDSAGCSVVDSITITDPLAATLSFSSTSTLCPGVCNGTATVTTSSASSPYTYSWSTIPVQTDQMADSLCAGTYSVTVTDSLGCWVDSAITITELAPFALSFSSALPLCPASCNGLAYVTSASPYTPLSYSWNTLPPQITDTANSLCAGTYSVIVTDSMGCISSDSVSVSDPVLTLALSSTSSGCDTVCNGTATAIATGPVSFTYLWSNNDSTSTILNLCSGTYTVVATDSNNCVLTDSVTVTQPAPPGVSLTFTQPLCYGQCNGIAYASPTGNGPFTFTWSAGGTDSTITNACGGWNIVIVTDSNACSVIDSIDITQPDSLELTSGNTLMVTCHGACDGYLSVNVTGGTYPYDYLWSNGSAWPDQLNLCAGTYTVTVTDTMGCTQQFINTVTEPDTLMVILTSTNATCQGCNDGTISTSVTGGSPPYNYFFTPIGTDTTHVTAGTYYLCVTDVNACLSCDSTIVSEPNGIFELSGSSTHLHVYPNPFNSTAIIILPSSIASSENLKVDFYNMLGKQTENISFSAKKSAPAQLIIERKNISSGMYLFKVSNKEGNIGTGRFIVE